MQRERRNDDGTGRADTLKLPADERALFDVATELEEIALNDEYFRRGSLAGPALSNQL